MGKRSQTAGSKVAIYPYPCAAQSLRYRSLGVLTRTCRVDRRKVDVMLKVSIARLKKLAFVPAGLLIAATLLIVPVPARTATDDGAALYKTKCVACHGATAEKKFDATKANADLIQTVLKGKKMEKPPNMPEFESKGITADQATALVAFMKSLH